MIHFTRLRLSGFKSFVDPTEVSIGPGMTGIVGPNGCGKSNLVEALRWAMGETSARQMRGSEMDDVIFGGSANRPRRNLAEVTLGLDNRDRNAPALFNDADELEVTRRIERGQGSNYKVNGKETRARDVQVLFADAATGARSTAIVSQGRIGALINAKPSDRRGLLEEAAGISGLHARRHETELRLKAAEANLERLEDVLSTLDGQLGSLRKQARQAQRYRSLSQQIRETEGQLLAAQWVLAIAEFDRVQAEGADLDRKVAELTGLAAAVATRQAEAAAALPQLRTAESAAAAALQQLVAARDQLDAEEGRLAAARRDMETRLRQIDTDGAREAARRNDAEEALARLAAERQDLLAAGADEAEREAEAVAAVEAVAAAVAGLDAEVNRVMEEVAAADAERAAALRAQAEAETRRDRLARRAAEIGQQRARAEAETVDRSDLTAAEMDLEEALEFLETCRERAEAAEGRRAAAQAAREAARAAWQDLTARRAKLRAEADGLKAAMAQTAGGGGGHAPALDALTAVAGYEAALGAALGDDLGAPLLEEEGPPFRWQGLPPLAGAPALPEGVEPLSRYVTAPPALARRLAQIGVVADAADGPALRLALRCGQRLVSRDGALWRWDGFTGIAGAPSTAALRLRQRNRLRELEAQIDDAELGVEEAEGRAEQAAAQVERETQAERQARDEVRRAEGETSRLRDAHARLAQRAAAAQSQLALLRSQEEAVLADLEEAQEAWMLAGAAAEAFAGQEEGRDRLAGLRADLAANRSALIEARSALDGLRRDAAERRRRLDATAAEQQSWSERAAAAGRIAEELAERRETVVEELERLVALPLEIEEKRQDLLDRIAAAEEGRRLAAAALADGEQEVTAADRALKEAEHCLAATREERIRREAALAAAAQAARALAERIAERLETTPEALMEAHPAADPAGIDETARRLERLNRDREAMGPVNLRAEAEVEEMERQIGRLQAERDDLVAAIAKLRQGIVEINREGRDRLQASFELVDGHFRSMFTRLFGGGRAHLTLTESADPLQAGLEIMASPPGKRLQILSLLSGGEQALTALALLFAVFMTNPAPICVLDEVDAPLDDANVDRFCGLVAEIAERARTRFLVITHHRMTMARMDRLFGVTMAERGVSTLVSVDLHRAEALSESS